MGDGPRHVERNTKGTFMLNFSKDRIDYGEQLRPPIGFEFDCGIATTYSLDLNTLTAASLALALDQTLEGDLSGEKVALLESLERLEGRLAVFYQKGNVSVPPTYSRLFTLLEPLLYPIRPLAEGKNDAFTSFHPKLWLVRYRSFTDTALSQYRLVVLSRNLTYDRSWDLAASIDGTVVKGRPTNNAPLVDFVSSLSSHAPKSEILNELVAGLPSVIWECPLQFRSMMMLPGGGAHIKSSAERFKAPLNLGDAVGDVLVISPFVDAGEGSQLDALRDRSTGKRTLISRADTLDRIGIDKLEKWDCYSLSQRVIDGEERSELTEAMPQDLHAKLIVTTSGKTTHWHLGSANMTNAAFGKKIGDKIYPPRNSEFMLRLTGSTESIGPKQIIKGWKDFKAPIFTKHEFSIEKPDEDKENQQSLRILVHQLISAKWLIDARQNSHGTFECTLQVTGSFVHKTGFEIKVGLLSRPNNWLDFVPQMKWSNLLLTDLSAFVPIHVIGPSTSSSKNLVIQATLRLDRQFDRKQAVFQSMIDTPEKIINYMEMILDPHATKSQWLGIDHKSGLGNDIFGFESREELFERLMRCVSRAPTRLDRAISMVEKLRLKGVALPEGLVDLVQRFKKFREGK